MLTPPQCHTTGMDKPQTYANHRQIVWITILAGIVLLAETCRRIVEAVRQPSVEAVWMVVVCLALLVVFGNSRRKAMIVQDRVIRLEMRLRLEWLLPPEQHVDIPRLTLPQLVALRFAGDKELPGLVTRTLAGEFATPDAIKRAVRDWQADRVRV